MRLFITIIFLLPASTLVADEFLFLCEINWNKSSSATVRCMKDEFGPKAKISKASLLAIHEIQMRDMRRRFSGPGGNCTTKTNKTRMSLDVRTTCKSDQQIIEFASIWPVDIRTKLYFRSSMPEIIESKMLEFFRRTHFARKSDKPFLEWNR